MKIRQINRRHYVTEAGGRVSIQGVLSFGVKNSHLTCPSLATSPFPTGQFVNESVKILITILVPCTVSLQLCTASLKLCTAAATHSDRFMH